jgi:hypothetical protein
MRLGCGLIIGLLAAMIMQIGCAGGRASSPGGTGGGGTASGGNSSGGTSLPKFNHAFVVVEENHSYSAVIGSPSMPYLNGLASANGLATQYYADAHPSLPNYFELTVGEGTSITGIEGDSYKPATSFLLLNSLPTLPMIVCRITHSSFPM